MNLVQKKQNLEVAEQMFRDLAIAGRLTPDLKEKVESGRIKYRDSFDYIKANLADSGGIQDLLKSSTDDAVGISTFDKNRLAPQNARLVHKMRVGYGEGAGDLQSIVTESTFKAALNTADIIIMADGNEVFRAPASAFVVAGSNVKPNERFLELDTPYLLPDNKEIKVQVKFADGTTLEPSTATQKCAVEVEFGSIGTFV